MADPKIKYDPAVHPHQAQKLCERGCVDWEIAEFFEISPSTLYRWRNEHPEFADALVMGKEFADVRVERALYNRAVGYNFEAEKLITVSMGGPNGSVVERHKIIEHMAPDVKAAVRWLESRKPKEWRRTVGLTGGDGGPVAISNAEDTDFSKLSTDERAHLRSLLAKAAESGSDEE